MTSISGAGAAKTPATTGIHTSNTSATGTVGNAEMGKDTFLKLLVAQLKYQDPSNPTDSSQFMAQTAQFTMVEKLEALADSQTALLNASQLQSATALVGHTVEWNEDGVPKSGKVDSITMTNGSARVQVGDTDLELSAVTKVT